MAICEQKDYTLRGPQHLTTLQASTVCYGDSFTFLYAYNVRTSQETHLRATTACYGDSSILLYVYDVRTTQETHVRATTAYFFLYFIYT
jgi:hypothetical protein